jgi:CSLREA domain-containing protein
MLYPALNQSKANKTPLVWRLFWTGLAVLLALLRMPAPAAYATTITVNTTSDEVNADGDCSLREAIIAANTDTAVSGCPAGNGFDVISLPAGTYELTVGSTGEDAAQGGDLDITEGLTLNGAGRVTTTIDGDRLDRVFHIRSGNVQITGVTITGGYLIGDAGAGIRVSGGSLTLVNNRVTDNIIAGTTYQGGGIYFSGDTLTVNTTWIDNNTATGVGGGLFINYDSAWTLVNSRVENNTAGGSGGIQSHGTGTIDRSSISGNTATTSTSGAGGISSTETLTVVNSTISGNRAPQSGGGLVVGSGSVASLYNVTITNNTADSDGSNLGDGGGIRIASGTVNLQHTIIAGNFDNSSGVIHPDCSGTFTSQGYNLIQNTTGCTINGNTTGNKLGVDPNLGPLADNGGSTLTHALPAKSPAVDAGNPGGCPDGKGINLTIDQRGYARPVNGNTAPDIACDIGAFERLSPGTPTPTATPTATATSSPTASPTATATSTRTPTATSTATKGPSPTPTHTVTPGPSPTPSNTTTSTPPTSPGSAPGEDRELYLPIIVK